MHNTKKSKKNINSKIQFNYMLAGLIDGYGYLGISNKKYTCCEITVGYSELSLLQLVKKNIGGTINLRNKVKVYRWRLYRKQSMCVLVESINGKCLSASKKLRLLHICEILKIPFNSRSFFNINTYWLTGFFEAEGYFNVNSSTLQCSITVTRKNPELLENMKSFLGGYVYYDKSWNGYIYSCTDKISLQKWFTYFSQFPLKSRKNIDLVRFKRIVVFKNRKYHISHSQIYVNRFYKLLALFKARRYSPL